MCPQLCVGPLSSEIVEAVVRYSHVNNLQLTLIASKNQIDYNGGYVNGWNTPTYVQFVRKLEKKYNNSKILLCRDHCGPGFNGIYDLCDVFKTVESDISSGFDLIHVDYCHFPGSKKEILLRSAECIDYILKLDSEALIEVGTDENIGRGFLDLEELKEDLNYFCGLCTPLFYVVQTGSLVKELEQVGTFRKDYALKVAELLHASGIKLKEHNADYFSRDDLVDRKGIVDALNIAPQLGVLQTQFVLYKCALYGINANAFLSVCYNSRKWLKWLYNNTNENVYLCSVLAGHYNFSSKEYQIIIDSLDRVCDIREEIVSQIVLLLDHYLGGMCGT